MKKSLDLDKIKNKIRKEMSTEEALSCVEPIQWSQKILDGEEKVIITGTTKINDEFKEYIKRTNEKYKETIKKLVD